MAEIRIVTPTDLGDGLVYDNNTKQYKVADSYVKTNTDGQFRSVSVGDYAYKTKKIVITSPNINRTTTVDTGIQWDKYVSIFVRVKISDTSCELFNNISYTTNSANTELTILNNVTSRFNGKEMTLYITYET